MNLNIEGTYTLTWTVIDSHGNETIKTLTVDVIPVTEVNLSGYSYDGYNGYYSSLNGLIDNESIVNQLASIIRSNITYIKYGESTSYTSVVDTIKGGQFILYDNTELIIPMGWPSGGNFTIGNQTYSIDREHVWAASQMKIKPINESSKLVSFTQFVINTGSWDYRPDSDDKGHYSDQHNLWNAVRSVNQNVHSNYFYYNTGTTGAANRVSLNGEWVFYPGDRYKGDIARTMFYMTLMYSHLTLINYGETPTSSYEVYYGYLDALLQWNLEDPVSQEELDRNDLIEQQQGNRNPFIDFYYEGNFASEFFALGDPEVPYIV